MDRKGVIKTIPRTQDILNTEVGRTEDNVHVHTRYLVYFDFVVVHKINRIEMQNIEHGYKE